MRELRFACYLRLVESIVKRAASLALLVLHLIVVTASGALATENAAFAAGPRIASVGASPPAASAAATTCASTHRDRSRPGVDQGARGNAGNGAAHGASGDLFLPAAGIAVGPAALVGLLDWRSPPRVHRSLRHAANGARAPPSPRL